MKTNLDIDLDELPMIEERTGSGYGERIRSAAQPGRRQNAEIVRSGSQAVMRHQTTALSEANLAELNGDGRPQLPRHASFANSSQGGRPRSSQTYTTQMASHMSTLPELNQQQVMAVARVIFQGRSAIVNASKATNARFNLRDSISSTQIYQICKRNGIYLELSHLKVLLRELGLPFNGPSCSMTLLLNACKAYINGISGGYGTLNGDIRSGQSSSDYSRFASRETKSVAMKLRGRLRDIIYTS